MFARASRKARQARRNAIPFTRPVRFVLAGAIDHARMRGHQAVDPVHLLLGLLEHAPDLFGDAFTDIRQHVEATLSDREMSGPGAGTIPYSDHTRKVLAVSREVASARGAAEVGLSEVLEALRRVGGQQVRSILRGDPVQPTSVQPGFGAGLDLRWLTLSDKSEKSYPRQIFAQLSDAIATGLILPGERLPAVRELAEQLDLAPGTVAKAFRDLQAAGIVTTSRAHGTVVAAHDARDRSEPSLEEVAALLRPGVVAAYHLGATAQQLVDALQVGAIPIYGEDLQIASWSGDESTGSGAE